MIILSRDYCVTGPKDSRQFSKSRRGWLDNISKSNIYSANVDGPISISGSVSRSSFCRFLLVLKNRGYESILGRGRGMDLGDGFECSPPACRVTRLLDTNVTITAFKRNSLRVLRGGHLCPQGFKGGTYELSHPTRWRFSPADLQLHSSGIVRHMMSYLNAT